MEDIVNKGAPQLVVVLKEMKDGLDALRSKVQALTAKINAHQYATADGISYLDAKHLLLFNYCQSLVYYLLRKAKGLSVAGHPVIRSLVETRLFLEKIRPIDKKMQYQIEKLTRAQGNVMETAGPNEKEPNAAKKTEDLLRYRPNPDMLISKEDTNKEDDTGLYRPPKFAPTAMEEDKMSKQDRNAMRKEKNTLRMARQSTYIKDMMDEYDEKPEEHREMVGSESRELTRYLSKMEERARQEEDLYTRAPVSRMEKKKEKYLKKSRNGMQGLTDSFYDEVRAIPMVDDDGEQGFGFNEGGSSGRRKFSKRKRKH